MPGDIVEAFALDGIMRTYPGYTLTGARQDMLNHPYEMALLVSLAEVRSEQIKVKRKGPHIEKEDLNNPQKLAKASEARFRDMDRAKAQRDAQLLKAFPHLKGKI